MPEEDELEAATEEEEPKEILDDDNIVMHCALRSDIDRLKQVFDSNDDPNHEAALNKLNEKNKFGKTPSQMACMLGNEVILQEIIKRGIDVNEQTATGYTLLHTAACWGHRPCLEALFENGANLNLRNNHRETAKQVAVRYKKDECIEYLDWAAAKQTLENFIAELKEMIADPEKLHGNKLSKEEKTSALAACAEKLEWIENTPDATVSDFLMKKEELETQAESVLAKANLSAPNTGSSEKK